MLSKPPPSSLFFLRLLTASPAASSLPLRHPLLPAPEPEVEAQKDYGLEAEDAGSRSHWPARIRSLCAAGDPDGALRLLDRLRIPGSYRPDPLSLTAVVHALCSSGRSDEAHHRLLLLLSAAPAAYDGRTINALLACLLDARTPLLSLRLLRRLSHAYPAFVPSLPNCNRLIHLLCSPLPRPLPHHAHRLLIDVRSKGRLPNAASYTALLNGYAQLGDAAAARQLLDEMAEDGVAPNSLTRSILIKAVLRKRDIDEALLLVHELWPAMEHNQEDASIKSAAFANLIDCLCREGLFNEVFRIAEEMLHGESIDKEFAYGQMIDSLCRAGQHHGASRIVYIMRKRGFLPSLVSYNCIVHGLSKERGCMRAYQLLKEGAEFGYLPHEATYKALVEQLCQENDLTKAKDVLELVLQKHADGSDRTRIYNIFLSALRAVDNPSEQLNVLVYMLQKQCRPDVITLNTVVHGFCKIGRVTEGKKIMEDMRKGVFGTPPDVVTFTTLIRGMLDVGEADEALHVLHETMPQCRCTPNVVTYNAVLRGLFHLQEADHAMDTFSDMQHKSIPADCATHTAIIEGLCAAGRIEEAKKFWDDVIWPSKIHDDYVYAAIFRGLCCLSKLEEACNFLYELVDCGVAPNIVSYNILIDAASKLGLKKEAYRIMNEMRKNGVKPDAVTWRILDRLHEKQRKEHAVHEEHPESMSKGDAAIEEDNSGDMLEGIVDPSFPPEQTEAEETCAGHGVSDKDVNGEKPQSTEGREPLSRMARRVFGLM